MNDYEFSDYSCPKCGHCPTHSRPCSCMFCDDGYIDEFDDDPINFTPGEEMTMCRECFGSGVEHWCPECGLDISEYLLK
jgi:hypothetical protein